MPNLETSSRLWRLFGFNPIERTAILFTCSSRLQFWKRRMRSGAARALITAHQVKATSLVPISEPRGVNQPERSVHQEAGESGWETSPNWIIRLRGEGPKRPSWGTIQESAHGLCTADIGVTCKQCRKGRSYHDHCWPRPPPAPKHNGGTVTLIKAPPSNGGNSTDRPGQSNEQFAPSSKMYSFLSPGQRNAVHPFRAKL